MNGAGAIVVVALVLMWLVDLIPFDAYLHVDARRQQHEAHRRLLAEAELEPTVPLHGELTRPGRDLERR
ncbi:MAG TPA: hypothetical protein VG276_28770 [Actinomycetes bacterium]|nr:hypothetical protein [Actinomycetes bacterium]